MNITGLLYNAVRHFRGPEPEDSNGAAGLSAFMGITATSLSHKVSPTYPSAHCSPEEIVAICQLTRDHAPLQAMAKALGYVLLPVVPPDAEMDPQYVAQVTASAKEFGEFLAEATTSYADRQIDDAEMRKLTKEFAESMAAQAHLFALLQAKHQAGKPTGEKSMVTLPVIDRMTAEAAQV